MPDLLDRNSLTEVGVGGDERLARFELRRQIGRMERQLAALVAEGFPRTRLEAGVGAKSQTPRALSLGELEEVRDSLAARLAEARQVLGQRSDLYSRNRELLEQMLADPARFKWVRISRDDIGAPGCGHWHSRPRLGLIGMLMGWWRVRISSGCPLSARLAAVEREA